MTHEGGAAAGVAEAAATDAAEGPREAIDRAVERRFANQIAFLCEILAMDTAVPPGDLEPAAEHLATAIAAYGLVAEIRPVPEPFARQNGLRSAANVVVRRVFGSGEGPLVVLQSNMDTSPAGEDWTADPLEARLREDLLLGLGAADSKGDVAAQLFALLALVDAAHLAGGGGPHPSGVVELHVTFDEETGGFVGVPLILSEGEPTPSAVIAAGSAREIGVAQGGCLHVEVVLRGRQARASDPRDGRDALGAALPILNALYAERDRLEAADTPSGAVGPHLTVGTIEGGRAANLVPGRVVFRLDRRIALEETAEQVEADLFDLIDRAAAGVSGVDVEARRLLAAEPVADLTNGSALADVLDAEARSVLGEALPRTAASLVSSARFYAEAGAPTVAFGVGPAGAEAIATRGTALLGTGPSAARDLIDLADLKNATQVLARTVRALLTGARL